MPEPGGQDLWSPGFSDSVFHVDSGQAVFSSCGADYALNRIRNSHIIAGDFILDLIGGTFHVVDLIARGGH